MQKPKSKTVVVNFRMNVDEVKEIKKVCKSNNVDMPQIMREFLKHFLNEKRCPVCNQRIEK